MADIDPIVGSITTVDNKTDDIDAKFPPEDVEGTFQQINESIKALNNSIKEHETRIALLEGKV